MAPIVSRFGKTEPRTARRPSVIHPLLLALVQAFPLAALARPAQYGPYVNGALKSPLPTYNQGSVFGGNTSATINTSSDGKTLTINQASQRGIYNWLSFDIDTGNSVVFNMAGTGYAALNRVNSVSGSPSQILGRLTATNGGEIFLVNRNGILFGSNAVVNVGGLIASTLDVTDAEFMSGLTNSLNGADATFKWKDEPGLATYDNPNNYVQVNKGAQITTASGGRVFLLAKDVVNAGSISTPDGQTVLAGGSEVYLVNPTGYTIYASEQNDKITSLKGLLVEVNGAGSATNDAAGVISAARGNVTIVAQAVNNSGRLSATTAVNQNGSVYLLARTGTTATVVGNGYAKQATQGGQLTLGEGSVIEVAPEASADKSDGNTTFTRSRVELSGQTIELQKNAQIVAHGGVVNLRAEDSPDYTADNAYVNGAAVAPSSTARVVLGQGARIDVSGTTDTQVSVARNFVTTSLLGAADLKDAPLQKDGPLYHQAVTFDVRSASPILGDTSAYTKGIAKTADEHLATGGTVSIATPGAVVMHETASVDVSGGKVTYTDDVVKPTTLVGTNGKLYTLNNAPKDMTYLGVVGGESAKTTRWGIRKAATANQQGAVESGYVDGQSAGTLKVVAPLSELGGQINGSVTNGARQLAGKDALATGGVFEWGSRLSGATRYGPGNFTLGTSETGTFGSSAFASAWMQDATVTRSAVSMGDDYWLNPVGADLGTSVSQISAATLNASGLGKIVITADGNVVLESGANLTLRDRTALSFNAMGTGGITLGASIVAKGGAVSATTADPVALQGAPRVNGAGQGGITLADGQSIDVSGDWVNQYLDASASRVALAGGSVKLKSAHGLVLADGSSIDVSGGAKVASSGTVSGTAAGSIVLEGNNTAVDSSSPLDAVVLNAQLSGYATSKGASLRIKTGDVTIRAADGGPASQSIGVAGLDLTTAFFTQGGFGSYDLEGMHSLTLAAGADLAPRQANWLPQAGSRNVASGAHAGLALSIGSLADATRNPTNLTLASLGYGTEANGDLRIDTGSRIDLDNGAALTIAAQHGLGVDGAVTAHGGQVSMTVQAKNANAYTGAFELGEHAVIDVSGTRVLSPSGNGQLSGKVLGGGSIALTVADGNGASTLLKLDEGAVLRADGAAGELDVARPLGGSGLATQRQTVASTGGSIVINANRGGAVLAGSLSAHGGDAQTAGGSLTVAVSGATHVAGDAAAENVLTLQAGAVSGQATPAAGSVVVSTAMLQQAGFADVTLSSQDRIDFASSLDYTAARSLTLDAPIVSMAGAYRVDLGGVGFAAMGNSHSPLSQPDPVSGPGQALGQLTLRGGLVDLFGQQALQGTTDFAAVSQTEVRLRGVVSGSNPSPVGGLTTMGNVTLDAKQQVATTTASQYTLDASGHTVTVTGGDATSLAPLSAQSALTIKAHEIVQDGVVRAPFGAITFEADAITLGGHSLTSVSGDGLLVPYGATLTGGKTWVYTAGGAPVTITDPVAKTVSLNAAGGTVTSAAGARVDLSGGGDLAAYEFVAGTGGSKDIFAGAADGAFAIVPTVTGYAPSDAAILSLKDASGQLTAVKLGQQITFGTGGPIAAGTYAVLPARYALLPGAFLVKASSGNTSVALGYSAKQTDGSVLVGARMGSAGTGLADAQSAGYVVMSSEQARRYSEVDTTSANTYFTNQATYNGHAVPRRPLDAGTFNVQAQALSLPTLNFSTGTTPSDVSLAARGGDLNISSDHIVVSDTASSSANVLTLTAEQLNATGAQSVLLGGVRSNGVLTVKASDVTIDNGDHAVQTADLIVAATDRVTVASGATIQAAGSSDGEALSVQGDGALLRVSSNASATTARTGAVQQQGDIQVGAGARLGGGSVTVESTHSTQIAGTAQLDAQSLTLGAAQVAAGSVPAGAADASTLVVSDALMAQLASARDLTLRSFGSTDLYGTTTLGGNQLRTLTLDTANLQLHDAAAAQLVAGAVTLTNTSGSVGSAVAGSGTLTVRATGANGGSGDVSIGPGSMAVSGAAQTQLGAAGRVVFKGQSADTTFSTAGDLHLSAQSVTASTGAQHQVVAGGQLVIDGNGMAASGAAQASGIGAHLSLQADSIAQNGRVNLNAGELRLQAAGSAGGDAITFGAASVTDLSGASKTIDGVKLVGLGGTLDAHAANGDIRAKAGSLIDVSAPASGGSAGSVRLSAPQGSVVLDGRLVATSASGATGGSLAIDSANRVDLGKLAATIAAEQSNAQRNFVESIVVRNRTGDQSVDAGVSLSARKLSIEADSGAVNVAGALNANASEGGTLTVAAGGNLTVQSGAQLSATATGANQNGGQIRLMSTSGTITLASGAQLDTSATGTGNNGKVVLRAAQNAAHTDVKIDPVQASVTGAQRIEVEAVRNYKAPSVSATLISTITNDVTAFNKQAGAVATRVSGSSGATVQVRDGVEIDASGDLAVAGNTTAGGWDLTALRSSGGAPINLTLRAAGNLNVTGSVSDGFKSTGSKIAPVAAIQAGDGSTLRLVGGADLSAANVLTTQALSEAGNGDVVIGKSGTDVLVRTTTGDIQIAAGRDVKLTDPRAVVYTTGTPVAVSSLSDYKTPVKNLSNFVVSTGQSFFLSGGGSVAVTAQRDIVGANAASGQQGTDWWWRYKNADNKNQLTWFSRYDKFREGFATFGGGDVSASAGRDVVDAGVSAATSGYNASAGTGLATQFGGGAVAVSAGRDVLGGFVFAGGDTASVSAGRDVGLLDAGNEASGLQVAYENTALNILARNNLSSSGVSPAGLMAPAVEYASGAKLYNFYISGLSSAASMNMVSVAGNLSYQPLSKPSSTPRDGSAFYNAEWVPGVTLFGAANGSISLGNIWSATGTDQSALNILAQGGVALTGELVDQGRVASASSVGSVAPAAGGLAGAGTYADDTLLFGGTTPLDNSSREPLRIVAETGDLTYAARVLSTKPLDMQAGRDIRGASEIHVEHQRASELSQLVAGRDIVFPDTGSSEAVFTVEGPGDVLLTAGRNINLGTSGGLVAYGNRNVATLPTGSANLTLLAGVNFKGADYQAAQARYFELLGGAGVADHAGDLYAQLVAAQSGAASPGAGSAAAQAFSAQPVSSQLAQVRALVGDAAYTAAVQSFMRQKLHQASLGADPALQAFAQLGEADQAHVVGGALATAWSTQVNLADQQALAVALADRIGNPYSAALQAFVAQRTGVAPSSTLAAVQLFAALPVEQQALFTNQVLISAVRASGRTAAALTGAERDAAFASGYAAIATVFPDVATQTSGIDMGSSQIKTLQNSQVVAFTPDGGVNVGTLTSDSTVKTSADLGIVTSAGGSISMIVRDDVAVNQSRVFSVGKGDLLMWSSEGNLDAGKGAKTVTGAPPPVYYVDANGKLQVDTSGSFSGSGIAVLDSNSALDLFTPRGVINTGDAGIVSKGTAYFGGTVVGPNLSVAGPAVGAPAPVSVGNAATGLSPVAATNTSAGDKASGDDEDDKKKRRKRRNVILDFLGFGSESDGQK